MTPAPQRMPPMTLKVRNVRYFMRADARDDRRERPHDGHEAGQDEGLRAVLLEELVGLVDVLLLEELGVRPVEERRADLLAEHVARLVADDRGDHDQGADQPQREVQHCPSAISRPAVNSSESPGRKKPMSRPDSAKTIEQDADQPNGSRSDSPDPASSGRAQASSRVPGSLESRGVRLGEDPAVGLGSKVINAHDPRQVPPVPPEALWSH